MTMRAASAAVGIGDNRICDWENGAAQPRLDTLVRYGAIFGLTVSQLLQGVM
jgi:transcriptional regulator with XRE-family HTH domain